MVTGHNGHKPKRPQPNRPQTETATNRNGHRPKRPQTETATNLNGHKPDSPRNRPLWRNFGGLSWTNAWKQNSPVVGDLRVMKLKTKIEKLKYYPMHIWNRPWPFIYEHHNRVPMLLSVTFDKIATLVSTFYWAHKFVAHWIRYDCVYFYLWPFRFVAVSVCGRFGLWPFRFVAFRSVAVSVCGRSGLWPFRFVAV